MKHIFYYFISHFLLLSQGWALCESFIRQHERRQGIPEKLLSAIALVESGRTLNGQKMAWPWTVNANGVPYIFETKEEAVSKVRFLQKRGVRSIDVGCMQINLMHHPNAFQSLEDAFDPDQNIAYSAQFLKEKRSSQGNWVSAVAHYHSMTKRLNTPYKNKVLQQWEKIQNMPGDSLSLSPPLLIKTTMKLSASPPLTSSPFFHTDKGGRHKLRPFSSRLNSIHPSKKQIHPQLSVREYRIPLEIFDIKKQNRYSIKNSIRFSPHKQ